MSKLPDDTILVDDNKRIIRPWLGFLRSLEASSDLSTADVTTLKTFIAAADAILADPEPFPEFPTFTPYSVDVQQFDASGTWTKPSFGSIARVQIWSAGGSGASRTLPGDNNATGGGGGAHREEWFLLSELGDTETVTVGSGGLGVTGSNNGNPGGDSSFGSFITVPGGGAGVTDAGGAAIGGFGAGLTPGSTGIGATPGATALTHASGIDTGAPGGGCSAINTPIAGGNAIRGGAGGGAKGGGADSLGGTADIGGNGGVGATASGATDGQAPGGGGGGCGSGTSGAGGNGRVIVTVF